MMFPCMRLFRNCVQKRILFRNISYTQGQEPEPKIREYFYYIDHEGRLFLDDAKMKNFTSCYKDKKFIHFFFNNLKKNTTDRYTNDFPYISLCGRERNYVRCDDCPIVFTHVVNLKDTHNTVPYLLYSHAGELLKFKFMPMKIFMLPETGRVYHPAPFKSGNVGLIRSKLAIELSKNFQFRSGDSNIPTHFKWNETFHMLDQEWYSSAKTTFENKT